MCAYGNVTSDTGMACSGDSGGPMVVRENERSELLFNSDYSNYNCVQEYLDWCYKLWCATIHKWNLYHTLCTAVYACCLCTNRWRDYELDQRQHRWQNSNEEKQLRRYIGFFLKKVLVMIVHYQSLQVYEISITIVLLFTLNLSYVQCVSIDFHK